MKYFLLFLFPLCLQAKTSFELRVPLTLSGFQKLRPQFTKLPTKRSDIYFDAFDGDKFILQSEVNPLKLRVKKTDDKYRLQVTVKQSDEFFSCGRIKIYGSKRDSKKDQLNSRGHKAIESLSLKALETLSAGDRKAFELLEKLQQNVFRNLVDGKKHGYGQVNQ